MLIIVCSIIVCTQVLLIVCSIVVMYWHGALLPQTGLQLSDFGQFPEEFLLEVTAYLEPNARSYLHLSRSFAFFGIRLANLYVGWSLQFLGLGGYLAHDNTVHVVTLVIDQRFGLTLGGDEM